VLGFGEGALQKTGILQFFYRSGKVCTRLIKGVWITPPSPIFGALLSPPKGLVGKEVLPWKKSFLEDGVNYSVTRRLRTG